MENLLDDEDPPLDVAGFLWRHKTKLAVCFFAVMSLTLAYFALAQREFQSEAKVLVRIGRESVTLDPTATTGQFVSMVDSRESELHAVEELIASHATAEKIVNEFGPGTILEQNHRGGPHLRDRLAWLDPYNLNPLRVYSLRDKSIKTLRKNLGIFAGKKSNVLSISYKAGDSQLAHDVLDALLRIAREEHVRIHRTNGSQSFFENQSERFRSRLNELERQQQAFKDQHGLAALATQRELQLNLVSSLRADFLRATAEQSGAQAEVDLRRKQLSTQPALVVTAQTTGQPQTARQTLREKLYELEVREKELSSRLKDDAPQLVQIRQQIAEARRIADEEQILMQTTRGVNQAHQATELALQEREAQLVALTARTQTLAAKIEAANADLKLLNEAETELNRLDREIELARANYRKYSENLEQARIDHELETAKISSLSLLQPPTLSPTPVSPQPMPTLAFGTAMAVIVSIGVALIAERRPVRRVEVRPRTVPLVHGPAGTQPRTRRSEAVPANPR